MLQATKILEELLWISCLDPELSVETATILDLKAGVKECLISKQPVLAALFLYKRPRSSIDTDGVDFDALYSEIKRDPTGCREREITLRRVCGLV